MGNVGLIWRADLDNGYINPPIGIKTLEVEIRIGSKSDGDEFAQYQLFVDCKLASKERSDLDKTALVVLRTQVIAPDGSRVGLRSDIVQYQEPGRPFSFDNTNPWMWQCQCFADHTEIQGRWLDLSHIYNHEKKRTRRIMGLE